MNWGLKREELQSGKPIIGIAQSGSDLSPCNRHHLILAERVREGIREAGGIAFEFPVHPIQETGKRPTASLDRNLAYLGLVEDAVRLFHRRRGADDRLRQDHAGATHGRGDRGYSRHRAVGRSDAERLVPRRAHRLGHHRMEGASAACGGRDQRRSNSSIWSPRRRRRRATATRWARPHHELARRGAGHVSAGLRCGIPAPHKRSRGRSPTKPASASSRWCGRICVPPRS